MLRYKNSLLERILLEKGQSSNISSGINIIDTVHRHRRPSRAPRKDRESKSGPYAYAPEPGTAASHPASPYEPTLSSTPFWHCPQERARVHLATPDLVRGGIIAKEQSTNAILPLQLARQYCLRLLTCRLRQHLHARICQQCTAPTADSDGATRAARATTTSYAGKPRPARRPDDNDSY